ncbi:MAG: GNAT family N-acetyltransferase [Leptospiraceae bacterium]|nr:GNAT family N-acetyltransferase [Leptospiraceae bacterium]
MRLIRELDEAQVAELHQLYQHEWWTQTRTLDEVREGVRGSQACYAILSSENQLIAFARVLTDYVFKALIFDVIVRPDFRGQGLGDQILSHIIGDTKLARVKHFELYCLPEMEPFYLRHGFTADVSGVKLLRRSVN